MSSYVDQYTSIFAQLEHMGQDAAIPESHKAPILLAVVDANCAIESTAAALGPKKTVSAPGILSRQLFINEYNSKQFSVQPSGRTSRGKYARNNRRKRCGKKSSRPHNPSEMDNMASDDNSNKESPVRAVPAPLQTGKSDVSGARKSFHCGI